MGLRRRRLCSGGWGVLLYLRHILRLLGSFLRCLNRSDNWGDNRGDSLWKSNWYWDHSRLRLVLNLSRHELGLKKELTHGFAILLEIVPVPIASV